MSTVDSSINRQDRQASQFANKEGTTSDFSNKDSLKSSDFSNKDSLKSSDYSNKDLTGTSSNFSSGKEGFDKTNDSSLQRDRLGAERGKDFQQGQQQSYEQQQAQGMGFQKQLAGSQPLSGQGIAGGSFNRETGVGLVNLKPICIEQEPVMYRPQALTIPQPPLMVQPEAITIPQPPIVIHPEPIVIPQPPLVFQPPAVAVPRPAVTIQPEPVMLNRPSYSVQPTIQFDLQGCNKFNQPDFKQHVHVKLGDQQQGQQGLQSQQSLSNQQLQGQQQGQGQGQDRLSDRVVDGQQSLQGQPGMGLQQSQHSSVHQRMGSGQFSGTGASNTLSSGTTKEPVTKSRNDYA